ncbi:MAG: hypothetical protein IKS94_02435 [Prevotella sp.]|nr:hypothetical protein [Prevotella sp.]
MKENKNRFKWLRNYWPWVAGVGFILLANYLCNLNVDRACDKGVLWQIEMPILILIALASIEPHLYLQGGGGIIFAVTYGVVLYRAYHILRLKYPDKNRFLPLLIAHLFGFFASYLVHAGYNFHCIIVGTF